MRKNKKLLTALALNSLAMTVGNAGTKTTQIKYEQLYNKIIKNAENGKSNLSNYDLLENILNKRNKELKDLYLQGDYIVKPEYMEWQIFFTGFYDSSSSGNNNKFYDQAAVNDLRVRREFKFGAAIPKKEVKETELDINVSIPQKEISLLNLSVPALNIEKIKTFEFLNISEPSVTKPNISLELEPEVEIEELNLNINFNAGHNLGIPLYPDTPKGPRVILNTDSILSDTTTYTTALMSSSRFVYSVRTPNTIFDENTNSKVDYSIKGEGLFFSELSEKPALIANFGRIEFTEKTVDAYIFGDGLDAGTRTTLYNGGTFVINSAWPGSEPSGVSGIALFENISKEDSNKLSVNDGTVELSGYGNYGMLNFNLDHTLSNGVVKSTIDPSDPGKIIPVSNGKIDINLMLNRGLININTVSNTGDFGNVGISAYQTYKYDTSKTEIKDSTSYILNHGSGINSEGVITSVNGNNILLQHKGSGYTINQGVLDIQSKRSIAIIRENIGSRGITVNTAPVWDQKNSVARSINNGMINISRSGNEGSIENVIGMKGIGYTGSNIRETYNIKGVNKVIEYTADSKIKIENGDGITGGFDLNQNGSVTGDELVTDIDKGKLNGTATKYTAENNIKEDILITYDVDTERGKEIYSTKDGVIFIGAKNSVGMYAETKNVLAGDGLFGTLNNSDINALPTAGSISFSEAINNRDGKIFIFSSGNSTSSGNMQYSLGMYGKYATLNNQGGIYLGLLPLATYIEDLASDVKTKAASSNISNNLNYVGIFGEGSSIKNSGLITDEDSVGAHNTINSIGIFGTKKEVNNIGANIFAGSIENTGNIILGEGGKGIVGIGVSIISSGNIEIIGSSDNDAVGIMSKDSYAVVANSNITIGGENSVGIYSDNSSINVENIDINGQYADNIVGIVMNGDGTENLTVGDNLIISLTGKNNIGIYGKKINYINNAVSDYLDITLGDNGVGVYLKDLVSNIDLKVKKIVTGNSSDSQMSGGIYIESQGKVDITAGDITIGNTQTAGEGFGIYASGSTGNIFTGKITVNENSGIGLYVKNIENIETGDVTTGKTGIFQDNNSTVSGNLKTGTITLIGNEDDMLGLYAGGSDITDVEINGLNMNALNNSVGIYIEKGSFKTNSVLNVTAGNESYGFYVNGGGSGHNLIDFGSNNVNIDLGTDSIGMYLENSEVVSTFGGTVKVGNTTSTTNQSVGFYAKNMKFNGIVNMNINAGNKSAGVYFDENTGDVTYNGNINIGEKSLGIYKNGGVLTRDPISQLVFSAGENKESIGVFLDDSVLDFTTSALNINTLKMNEGTAFLLKGNNSKITINGIEITNADLDKFGLAPKVERIVYSEKNQVINDDMILDSVRRYYGYHVKDGRLELNGTVSAAGDIDKTYGILAEGRFAAGGFSEEIYLSSNGKIDMSNSVESIGIEVLNGARVKNDGIVIVGKPNSSNFGTGIFGESTLMYESIVENNGEIRFSSSGVGIYLDSVENGGQIQNNGKIISSGNHALGIYARLSDTGIVSPLSPAAVTNIGKIDISDDGIGIYAENTKVSNSGDINTGNYVTNGSIGIYVSKKSEISNTNGNISVGENGIAFYGDNSKINILSGVFNVNKGSLIYAVNNTDVNFAADNVTLGDKIGMLLFDSKLDLNNKTITVSDNGIGIYAQNTNSEIKNSGNLILGSNSTGIYLLELYY